MVTDTGKIKRIIKENRLTYYKLHPNQAKYPGAIVEMPNLPNDQYHWELWQAKGYKTNPQDLLPGKKLVKIIDAGGKETNEWKFDVASVEEVHNQMVKCPKCGQECIGEFGLNSHMRKHDKEKK